MSRFIQIGVTALRDPGTGEFLPAVPLYIEATTEAAAAEVAAIKDVSGVFAKRMKEYIDAHGGLKHLERPLACKQKEDNNDKSQSNPGI